MRIINEILLLVLTALAAMALAATTASAQAVEIQNEESGTECAVALSNCEVELEGETHIIALPAGVEVTTCEDTYHIKFNHNGTGTITWTNAAHGGAGCVTTNCTVMSATWPINSTTETAANTAAFNYTFCLRSGTTEFECNTNATIVPNGELHRYEMTVVASCLGGARRWEVHGFTHEDPDGHHPIEIEHA